MQCERIRKLISRWHRDELGAERKAARRKCSKALASRHYPNERGARFSEGGGRFTGMPRMTLRLRYRTWKLARFAESFGGCARVAPGLPHDRFAIRMASR